MSEHAATPTEKALAVAVNILVWRGIWDAIGRPGWEGSILAGFGMAAAADPDAPAILSKIGGIISTPGAITVTVLRQTQELQETLAGDGPAPDVTDATWTTKPSDETNGSKT